MATRRSKPTPSTSRRRTTPSQRRRVHMQALQGRYPVLPPIGTGYPGQAGWMASGPLYQPAAAPVGQQNIMIPNMQYPMASFQQVVPYVAQPAALPVSVCAPQLPYMAVPTSTLCYYTGLPWPVCQWVGSEPDDVIAELLPDDQWPLSLAGSSSHVHTKTLADYDPKLLSKICEEICSELVEDVVTELTKQAVTDCIDEMIKSYLGQNRLLKSTSLERPKSKPSDVRPSTNPMPSSRRTLTTSGYRHIERQPTHLQPLDSRQGQTKARKGIEGQGSVEKRQMSEQGLKHNTQEVAEHICLLILDELLFQRFLQVAVMGELRITSEALADSIVNELLFENFLKHIFVKKASPKASELVPISNQLL